MSDENVSPEYNPVKTKRDRPWTPQEDARRRELLALGWTRTRIGGELGRSKGSIIGRCHRRDRPDFTPYTPPPNVFPSTGRCLWPHGDPGEPGFGFCGAQTARGQVFCEGHCTDAYIGTPKDAADQEIYE